MKYRIQLQPQAERDIESAYLWIRDDSPARAARWRQRLLEALQTLERNPARCPLAPDQQAFDVEVRQFLFGRRQVFRVLFKIQGDAVAILHVRHAARRLLDEE